MAITRKRYNYRAKDSEYNCADSHKSSGFIRRNLKEEYTIPSLIPANANLYTEIISSEPKNIAEIAALHSGEITRAIFQTHVYPIGKSYLSGKIGALEYITENEISLAKGVLVAHAEPYVKDELDVEIEKSKYMLSYEDDWDDEGSVGYTQETWTKAVTFVKKLRKWFLQYSTMSFPVPKIYHGPHGTIDLIWKNENIRFIINIPIDDSIGSYYGDDYKSESITIKDKLNLIEFDYSNAQLIAVTLLLLRYKKQ